jgi:hypothetical protein
MSCCFIRLSLVAALWAGFAWQVGAQEAAEKEPASEVVKATDIPKLIKQLDSEDFAERQGASSRLAGAAEMAIPALEKAAQGESREASMRAFDILRTHFEKGGPTAREAAKEALERIAKADAGGASRRATEILTPPTPATPPRNVRAGFAPAIPIMPAAPGFAPAPGGIRIAGARIVVAAGAIGGGTETKIKVENGVKTTEVKDKDRQVKIVDDPDKGLQLEVTETKDGKEKTEKYEAKNADELKTKHPEAYKIYEEYSAKGAGIRIGGFGAVPGAPGGIGGAVPADVEKMREEMKKRTEEMKKDMEKRMEESKQRSEESRKRAEETRRVLEGLRPTPAPAPAPPAPAAPPAAP